jgi:F5/8 type C domain
MMRAIPLTLMLLVAAATWVLAAPIPRERKPHPDDKNTNALIKRHREKLKLTASSTWEGWPLDNLFDQAETTAWFSQNGDSPQNGRTTWVQATFPYAVTIKRVTILGNRDPNHPTGYFVTAGTFELLDNDDKEIAKEEVKSNGEKHDFDWILDKPTKVRTAKFTATKCETSTSCVGLSEFQVE